MKTNPPPPERPSPAFKAFVESQLEEIMQLDRLSSDGRMQTPCPTCDGCGMLPGTAPDADVMNTPCPACNPWAKSAHDKAWQKNFIVPIAQTMKQKGVAYLLILIRDDGKASYVLDTEIPPNSQLTD